ncbi:ubiquitin-conjugating enzyme E2 W [Capronia coronata CBS 617.96]|uniref:Ubiquitin-conjugating enzyme E2 W n=1 Tax=Capronia coronata CBS 617.96 TaxID=1182541 RepID=W9Z8Z8_9EURO|nr:ubiquitin-conjugating enzyme E2 W [Capronia coronata CBS 617.96]EXJ90979.1 ubiquitin-conjugating enzyme E2 W [Capronia coronata CBS 617.96]
MFAAKRLGKELTKAKQKLPPGIELVKADDFREWQVDIRVLDDNPLYNNQVFRLSFIFSDNYPIEPPEVTFIHVPPSTDSAPSQSEPQSQSQPQSSQTPFLGRPIPIHPHIYSNGIICLDLLGTAGWSPVQSVESVCMSIQSMLTGNSKNERPQGDEQFCQSMGVRGPNGWSGYRGSGSGRGLKDVRFAYDDDTV